MITNNASSAREAFGMSTWPVSSAASSSLTSALSYTGAGCGRDAMRRSGMTALLHRRVHRSLNHAALQSVCATHRSGGGGRAGTAAGAELPLDALPV